MTPADVPTTRREAWRASRAWLLFALIGLLAGPGVRAQSGTDRAIATSVRVVSERAAVFSTAQQRRQSARRRATRRTPVRTARAATPVGPAWTSPRTAPALAADLSSILSAQTR